MSENISVVGLGKLGLCLSACFAERGFETIGVDLEKRTVDLVNQGIAPLVEPGLSDLLSKHGGKKLRATVDHREALKTADISFVLVGTPSNPDGSFSNRYVEMALSSLATALRESKKDYHLFVISSTVMPGSTEKSFIPLLEKVSGRKLNRDFGVCYDPDFVALGDVINGFLRPELVVIGETEPEAGARLEAVHRKLCLSEPHIARMSIISAEIAKVCLNAYITVKISFANTIANICERIPGSDVDAITQAIGMDRRISPYYFQGGLSFGGTCFPRDTHAFITLAEQYQMEPEIIKAVRKVNNHQDQHLAEVVLQAVFGTENKTVGILGTAFKADTPVITESPAIKLIRKLMEQGLAIVVYDKLALENTKALFDENIEYVSSPRECMERSGVCVLTYRSAEFKQAMEGYSPKNPIVLIDPWRMIDPANLNIKIKLIPLGKVSSQGSI